MSYTQWPHVIGRALVTLSVFVSFCSSLYPCHAEVTSGMAEVNGAKLYYETTGAGQPLVLIHGGLFNCQEWDEQFTALAAHYQVIRFDLPGSGRTVGHEQPYSDAEDIAGLLRFLKVEKKKAVLIGASAGGGIALNFALTHPERVGGLVLVGPGIEGWQYSPASEERNRTLFAIAGKKPEEIAELWLADPYLLADPRSPTVRQKFRQLVISTFQTPAAPTQPADPVDPSLERLAAMRIPTLILVGQQDIPEVLKISESLAQKIPTAKKVIVPNGGHLLYLERSTEFNRIVLEFLSTASKN